MTNYNLIYTIKEFLKYPNQLRKKAQIIVKQVFKMAECTC